MADTKIEWATKVWNPITGCIRDSSPGCDSCYARRMARRLAGRCGYPAAPNEFAPTWHPDKLNEPRKWRKPQRVFLGSMTDLAVSASAAQMVEILEVIEATPQHTYMILTKRPLQLNEPPIFDDPPLPNLWLGVSVCCQEDAWKIAALREIPAALHFVSFEPLLAPVDCDLTGIDWVICGGETGPGAREMELGWAVRLFLFSRSLNIPWFWKSPGAAAKFSAPEGSLINVREFPKKGPDSCQR